MSKYLADAERQAAEYEKRRREQEAAAIAAAERQYAAASEQAAIETAAGEQTAQDTMIESWNTAAVEKAVTQRQVREMMANLGLARSGSETARLDAASTFSERRVTGAKRTRAAVVEALRTALAHTEESLAAKRDAAVAEERKDAVNDIEQEKTKLMQAAYAAQAKEEAERLKNERLAREQAMDAAQQQTVSDEKNRTTALKTLHENFEISTALFAKAMEEGWSVERVLSEQAQQKRLLNMGITAKQMVDSGDLTEAYFYLEGLDLTDEELETVCASAGMNYGDARRWILGYREFAKASPAIQMLEGLKR